MRESRCECEGRVGVSEGRVGVSEGRVSEVQEECVCSTCHVCTSH